MCFRENQRCQSSEMNPQVLFKSATIKGRLGRSRLFELKLTGNLWKLWGHGKIFDHGVTGCFSVRDLSWPPEMI
jgi:hypothetical protein